MKTLQLSFKTSEGKTSNLTFAEIKQDLDEVTVKGAMQSIADSKLFVKSGVALYAKPVSAQYIERTVTEIVPPVSQD